MPPVCVEYTAVRTCAAVDANAGAVAVVRDAAGVHDDVVANVLQKQTVLLVVRHRRTVHVEFRLRFCRTPTQRTKKVKIKAFPYSIPSVGPRADPVSHPPGGRLPLLSARPAVTVIAAEHHCRLAGTKLYCLVTEARRCEQLAQGCYAALPPPRV